MSQIIGRLDVSDFKRKLSSGNFVLLDIRTSQEQIIFGKISENQTHIDVYNPDAIMQIQKLPRRKISCVLLSWK